MPDNYGRATSSEVSESLKAFCYPVRCSYCAREAYKAGPKGAKPICKVCDSDVTFVDQREQRKEG